MRVLRIVIVAFPTAVALLLLIILGLALAGRVERTVDARGEVQVKSYQVVRPQIAGFVRNILVEPGDRVEVGEPLVELEDPEFQREIAQARRRVVEVEAELGRRQLERSRGLVQTNPIERNRQQEAIHRRQLDAQITASVRREAELNLGAMRHRLTQLRHLNREGLVSDQRLLEGEQEVLLAEERAAQRQLQEERALSEIPESQRVLELLVAEQDGQQLALDTRIRQLEAERALWHQEVARLEALEALHTLRATLGGVVIGEPQNDLLDRYLAPGEELFQVIDPKSIRFVSQVPEEAMVRVRSGQKAQIELVGLPKNQFDTFAGRVERVSQLAVVEAGAVPGYLVDVHLDRPWVRLAEGPFLLRGGMRGTAQIAYRQNVPVLSVFYEFLAGKPQVPDAAPAPEPMPSVDPAAQAVEPAFIP